jgi:hypothetical protein
VGMTLLRIRIRQAQETIRAIIKPTAGTPE